MMVTPTSFESVLRVCNLSWSIETRLSQLCQPEIRVRGATAFVARSHVLAVASESPIDAEQSRSSAIDAKWVTIEAIDASRISHDFNAADPYDQLKLLSWLAELRRSSLPAFQASSLRPG